MDNFYIKYIKYKNKYIKLKNQIGGIRNKQLSKMREFVRDGYFVENEFKLNNDIHQTRISKLIKSYFDNSNNALIPNEPITEENFFGKYNLTDEDIKKLWIKYNKAPTQDSTVTLVNFNKYKYRSLPSKIITTFDNYITYDHADRTKVVINGMDIMTNNLTSENKFENIESTFKEMNINQENRDDVQMSSNQNIYSSFEFNETRDIFIERIKHAFGVPTEEFNLSLTKTCLYYKDIKTLFFVKSNEVNMYMVDEIGINKYNLYPYNLLKNLILNNYYESSFKYLFEQIIVKLNLLGVDTKTLPDMFFHIHVTLLPDSDYVLLTLHVKYEITSDVSTINYFYDTEGNNVPTDKIPMTRYSISNSYNTAERIKYIKNHSFYLFFNLTSDEHFFYNTTDNILNLKDSGKTLFGTSESIGIEETLFGRNVFDINYINGKSVLLVVSGQKCSKFCL